MKCANTSTVSVSFRNFDHASAFRNFLEKAFDAAQSGGDFEMAVVEGKNITYRKGIGHDVIGVSISHSMQVKDARQEVYEAQVGYRQLTNAIATIQRTMLHILNQPAPEQSVNEGESCAKM